TTIDPVDIDDDKDLDLLALCPAIPASRSAGADRGTLPPTPGAMTVILNNGDGTFAPGVSLIVGNSPASLTTADLDTDGDRDVALIVTNDASERVVRILRNDLTSGQLAFAPYVDQGQGTSPALIAAADLDHNGRDDLITISTGSLRAASSSSPSFSS